MTTNNLISMHKQYVVAGLWFRPAEFVVSIFPREYINALNSSM